MTRKQLARDVSTVAHWGNGDYEVIIKNLTNLEYVLTLIMQSYEKN
jgi:predicted transport protein